MTKTAYDRAVEGASVEELGAEDLWNAYDQALRLWIPWWQEASRRIVGVIGDIEAELLRRLREHEAWRKEREEHD